MTQDISQEAYQDYLDQYALFQKQWPNLAGQPKTYELWAEATQHRDHPRWTEYMDAYRNWKDVNFAFIYGHGPTPVFLTFPEWLEKQA